MIPGFCPDDAPPGERALYNAIAESEGSDDWFVLHSLRISEHVKNPEGEADFVIVAPRLGILVLEVKSHETIHYDPDDSRGAWQLGSQAPKKRGPFQQASEAMYSIRNYLEKRNVDLRSLPTLYAAWFTAVRARTLLPQSPEWHPWQVLDSEDLKRDPIGAIRRTFGAGTDHLDATFRGFSRDGVGPDTATASQVISILRPRFEVGVVAGDMRNAREGQLIHFIEEQYVALDSMSDNQQVLFVGPAGSGKTLLAMEAVRRELETGNHGRLLCFNRLLSKRLHADMPEDPKLTTGSMHSQMLVLAGIETPDDASANFWTQELPALALEALVEAGGEAQCDFLVVDEVQDLLAQPYLDVLDLMVKGGLASGRILMFGDFERQAIYDDGSGRELLQSMMPHMPSSNLIYNCRNLPRIGTSVNLFSGLKPGYTKFRRQDDGANPVWLKYGRGEDQSELLRRAVDSMREESYDLSEIVVLSPLGNRSIAATTKDPWLRQVLKPADGRLRRKGELQFSTIQAYKGLEAPAVIVTDLDRDLVSGFESVLYVGLTRATDRIICLLEAGTGLAGLAGKL